MKDILALFEANKEQGGASPAQEGGSSAAPQAAPNDGGAPAPPAAPAAASDAGNSPAAAGDPPAEKVDLFKMLGKERPAPDAGAKPAAQAAAPAGEPDPEVVKLRAENAALKDRIEGKTIIEKVLERLPEGYNKDEAREQMEFVSPLVRTIVEEVTTPLRAQIEAYQAADRARQDAADSMAFTAAEKVIRESVAELGRVTGSGIDQFPPEELDAMVGVYFASGDYPQSWNDEQGYLRIVKMINTDLMAAKARQAASDKTSRENAEARKVPGGRSTLPSAGDLAKMSPDQRKAALDKLHWPSRGV